MNVSVVIPTYNRAAVLRRALDSVFAQTRQPYEVIVIDDGSTDVTEHAVAGNYPGVVYSQQANKGVSAARNRGIEIAQGDWVAFLDSDDEWLPNKLEAQANALLQNKRYRICHTNEIWIRRGTRVNPKIKHEKSGGWIYKKCLPLCAISPSSVMIEKALIVSVGGFDEYLPACEDYDLWLRICSSHPVLYLEHPHIKKYGGHEDQLSRKYWGMDRFRIEAMEKILGCGLLDADNRHATLAALIGKLNVVLAGAIKHGNVVLADECRRKIDKYAGPGSRR